MSTLTPRQQSLIALAAVFEAAARADQIAHQGDTDTAAMEELLNGVMALNASDFNAIYPHPGRFIDGLRLLRLSLSRSQTQETARPLSYAVGLLHLTGRLRANSNMTDILRQRLTALESQRAHFDSLTSASFCHRLAGIYVDTLGTFRFRIRVQGNPALLQDEDNAARIRALFLSGVRAGFLWHQLDGRRWRLLFQRKRLYECLNTIKISELDR